MCLTPKEHRTIRKIMDLSISCSAKWCMLNKNYYKILWGLEKANIWEVSVINKMDT